MLNKLEIIKRLFSNSLSNLDLKNLFYWLNSEKGQNEIEGELEEKWSSFEQDERIPIDSNKMLSNIKNEISRPKAFQLSIVVRRFLPYAAILVVALVSAFFLNSYYKNSTNNIYHNTYTTFVTENGQRSKLVLPDSSVVWLNSGTSLSYLYNKKKKRSIVLNGQAFFEVKRDEKNPFLVESNGMKVKVLGTRFGVEAYAESDETVVVLESGSVELNYGLNDKNTKTLVPGDVAVFSEKTNTLQVRNTDVQKYISWKNNKLIFRNEPMREVIKDLERWFNVEVDVLDEEVFNSIFTGTITNQNYEQIFKLIEYSCSVKCKIETNNTTGLIPRVIMSKK